MSNEKSFYIVPVVYYSSLGKEMVPQQKNAGLKVTEVSQEDATLNFIVLKNVKSLNSENLRNWIFFFFPLPETCTPFGPIELLI